MRYAMNRVTSILVAVVVSVAANATVLAGTPERFHELYGAGNYVAAAEVASRLAEDDPQSWAWAYNAACAHALAGNAPDAGMWLARSADRGFSGIATVENEKDFEGVLGDPAFERGVEAVRVRAAARLEQYKRLVAVADPVIVEPPGVPEGPLPVVVTLHGTGGAGMGMAHRMARAAREVGALLAAPTSGRRAPDGGRSWTYRDEAEWHVLHVIDSLIESGRADPDRVVLVGYSQGANIALVMARTHPERFAGVVPVSGHYEHDIAPMPGDGIGARPGVYLMIGEHDEWAHTYVEAERAFTDAGYPCARRVLPRRGHAFPSGAAGRREIVAALRWVLDSGGGDPDDPDRTPSDP